MLKWFTIPLHLSLIEFRVALRSPLFRTLAVLAVVLWVGWSWVTVRLNQTPEVHGLGLVAAAVFSGFVALLLGVEVVDRVERKRARHFADLSPSGGWVLQFSRGIGRAAASLIIYPLLIVIYGVMLPLFGWPVWSLAGVVSLGLAMALPLALMGAFLGVAARCVLPSGLAATLGALSLFALFVAGALVDGWPGELILPWNSAWGLVVPGGLMLVEAFGWLLVALAAWGVASVLARPAPLGRVLRIPFGPVLAEGWRRLRPGLGLSGGVVGLLILIGLAVGVGSSFDPPGGSPLIYEGQLPPGHSPVLTSPIVVGREAILSAGRGGDPIRLRLEIEARGESPQSVAALSFGPHLVPVRVTRGGGRTQVADLGGARERVGDLAVILDPPLVPGETSRIEIELSPRRSSWRRTMRSMDGRYPTFEPLGAWYADGLRLDMRTGERRIEPLPSAFRVEITDSTGGLNWYAGHLGGSGVVIQSELAGVPAPVFAGDFVEVLPRDPRAWRVRWLVTREHEDIAGALQVAWEPTLVRLPRLLGEPQAEMGFVEIPRRNSALPMTISSQELQETEGRFLSDSDGGLVDFASVAERLLAPRLRTLLELQFDSAFTRVEEPALLRDAWLDYLYTTGLNQGVVSRFSRQRADYVVVPWTWVSWGRGGYPYDVNDAGMPGFSGPLVNRPEQLPRVPRVRREGVHHVLRGIIGDEAWVAMHRRLFGEGGELTVERWLATAEEVGGVDLAEFRRVYIDEGLVPELRLAGIDVARVFDESSGRLVYRTRVGLDFRDWRGSVPVVVATEGESLAVQAGGGANSLTVETVDRPLFVEVDPEGWMIQRSIFDEETNQRVRARLAVRVVRDESGN